MRAEFLFDLACPFTYLAAERVDRAFDSVVWTPASGAALRRGSFDGDSAGARRGGQEPVLAVVLGEEQVEVCVGVARDRARGAGVAGHGHHLLARRR